MPGLLDAVGASADSANSCSYLITRVPSGRVLLKPIRVCAQRKGIIGRIQEQLEPSVPGTTIVNDGSIFAVLGLWCALAFELQSHVQRSIRTLACASALSPACTVCGPVSLDLFSLGLFLACGALQYSRHPSKH